VASYLDKNRVEVEKTGDYTLLLLFSIGHDEGKWGTLLEAYWPSNALTIRDNPSSRRSRSWLPPTRTDTARSHCGGSATRCMPRSVPVAPIELLDRAFGELPVPATTPGEAYRRLVRARTERVPVSEMAGRVSAGHGRALPARHSDPDARRARRGDRRPGPALPARLEAFDARFPGSHTTSTGSSEMTRRLLDRMPQPGAG